MWIVLFISCIGAWSLPPLEGNCQSGDCIDSPPAGTYDCRTLPGKHAGTLTLSTDGFYTMGQDSGAFAIEDIKVIWRSGAFVARYGGASTLVADTDHTVIVLALPGDDQRKSFTCHRQP